MKMIFRVGVLLVLVALALTALPAVLAQGGLPVATLTCEQALRSQPTSASPPLALLSAREPMMLVTGRDMSGDWYVVLRQNGETGWLNDECLRVVGNPGNVPLTRPSVYEGTPLATVACAQYVRAEPSNEAVPLMILDPDSGVLEIIGRDEGNTGWLLVLREDGEMGWTYNTPCLKTQGDLLYVPVSDVVMPIPDENGEFPVEESNGLAQAEATCPQYVRSAPDQGSPALIILHPDDGPMDIIGRDQEPESTWVLIRRADGAMGWVSVNDCIVLQDDLDEMKTPYAYDVIMPVPGVSDGSVGVLVPPFETEEESGPVRPANLVVPEPYVNLSCPNYVRSAADSSAARLTIYYPGDDPLEILARDQPAEWLLVRRWDGSMGWVVNTECVNVTGNVFDAPWDTSVVMPVPGVTNCDMSAVADMLADSEAEGFVAPAQPETTPVPPPPEPYARLACPSYIRSAADNNSARLLILYPGDGPLEILARDQPAAWLLARWPTGTGWIVNTDCVTVTGNVFDAPWDTSATMAVPEAGPTPTAVPFPGQAPAENDWPPAG